MLIAVDHGNKQIKTVHTPPFTSGLIQSDTPGFGTDALAYRGKYYTLTDQRIPYRRDKTEDERFFILTLFAIAHEIEAMGQYSGSLMRVQLAVGLPPAHFGVQAKRFINYFNGRGAVAFQFKGKPYAIFIENTACFPQSFSAAAATVKNLASFPRALVVDIGGFTADYVRLRNGVPDMAACDSLENGVILLSNRICAKANAELDILLEESEIDRILRGEDQDAAPEVIALAEREAQEFIKMLQSMRDDGYAILLITHKLHEVMACSDVITVLRHGEIVEKEEKENGYDQERLISKMMGGEVTIHTDYEDQKKVFEKEEVLLEGKDMSIYNAQHRELIRHGNLTMKAGEIIGLAGISGRGQRELLETLFGVNVLKMGQLTIAGKDMTKSSIRDRIEAGMALVSEDPKRDNVVAGMKIYEHFALNGPEISYKKVGINWKDLTDKMDTSKAVKELGVPEKTRELATLSGGNIQRCMLARAVMKQPKILLASYPSRGLDVGTVEMVHQTLVELRNQGCSILLVSEDLEELLSVSDSIVVISGDTLTEKLDPKTTSALEIGDLMIGGKEHER